MLRLEKQMLVAARLLGGYFRRPKPSDRPTALKILQDLKNYLRFWPGESTAGQLQKLEAKDTLTWLEFIFTALDDGPSGQGLWKILKDSSPFQGKIIVKLARTDDCTLIVTGDIGYFAAMVGQKKYKKPQHFGDRHVTYLVFDRPDIEPTVD